MILPVWVEGWQLDCCGDDVFVGQSWEQTLLAYDLRGVRPATEHPGWTITAFGEVAFVADATPPGEDAAATLLDLGACTIGVPGLKRAGRVSGRTRIRADWHGEWEPLPDDLILCRGTVRRIFRVPIIYELQGARGYVIVGHEPPVPAESTRERGMHDDLVLDLEVNTQPA